MPSEAQGAAKEAELQATLARTEELSGDVQRGGMSSTLPVLTAVRRQLAVPRSSESCLRKESSCRGRHR